MPEAVVMAAPARVIQLLAECAISRLSSLVRPPECHRLGSSLYVVSSDSAAGMISGPDEVVGIRSRLPGRSWFLKDIRYEGAA